MDMWYQISPETKVAVIGTIAFVAICITLYVRSIPRKPDPWENLPDDEKPDMDADDASPVCANCLVPVKPHQHYCQHCGNVTGEYTRYIPFVNIPFNCSIVGVVWKKTGGRAPLTSKISILIFLGFVYPILPIIGIPILICLWLNEKYKKEG